MEHIEGHPHAFLDEQNIVLVINMFSNHDLDLLNQIKALHNAASFISCCEYENAMVGGDFYNGKFYPPKPNPEAIRDEINGTWIVDQNE